MASSLAQDRVRRHTGVDTRRRIDAVTMASLGRCSESPGEIEGRLRALEREWDTDRFIEAEAAATGLVGLALGLLVDRRLLVVPAVVASALLAHATTGWYPLLPLIRRLGVRSGREIARERYALKALRGDFAPLAEPARRPDASSATDTPGADTAPLYPGE